ncbi:glycoside hydrolase family 10 protein [Albibacterium profundi]|uniref:Family 10 glycosylhydrolase n=1 Tax=Albibacterium profundi TaxID=3134906 RepID=A0ABV5CGP4_9SPHI
MGKNSLRILICLFLVVFSNLTATAQSGLMPKREFRGVWVATVVNIDWPSKPGLSVGQQKAELIQIFDTHQRAGINAIIFQIRPAADALYAKSREPWSEYLTGVQGREPNPAYDPLAFAIEEAHARGMELHAWINPYRATFSNSSSIARDHITNRHPEWFFSYGGKKLFNPGLPEVRSYITSVVMDIVRGYDIDGVHFDDYFYPYPTKSPLPDVATFNNHSRGFSSIDDWRRDNVNLLIKGVSDSIKSVKPYVKFGVSPFGIWDNKRDHPDGSETAGFSGYRQLYADAKKWTEEGWVDYNSPQLYFPFNYRAAAFEVLLDWWAGHSYGRHLYIGQAAYRATERGTGWREPDQLSRQIHYLRKNENVNGSIFFSSKSLTNNLRNFRDSLQYNHYRYKALPPTMPWLDNIKPLNPRGLTLRITGGKAITLHWQKPDSALDGDTAYGYVIYRFESGEPIDINDPQNILHISYNNRYTTYTDDAVRKNTSYTYVITSIDRMKNESGHSNVETILFP